MSNTTYTTENLNAMTNKDLTAVLNQLGGVAPKNAKKATLVAGILALQEKAQQDASVQQEAPKAEEPKKASKPARVACDIEAIKSALESTQMAYELKERSGKAGCYVARLYIDKKPQVLLEIGKYSVRTYIHSTCALFESVKAHFASSDVLTGTYDRSATLTLDDISTFRVPEKPTKSDETDEQGTDSAEGTTNNENEEQA